MNCDYTNALAVSFNVYLEGVGEGGGVFSIVEIVSELRADMFFEWALKKCYVNLSRRDRGIF